MGYTTSIDANMQKMIKVIGRLFLEKNLKILPLNEK
jgi:hypothetical protein